MSFGPSQQTKQAMGNLGDISKTATGTVLPAVMSAGGENLGAGTSNVESGTNFFNTLLNGSRYNTTAMLQPNIRDTIANNAGTLRAINTLMPRGGGRSSALFSTALQPQQSITNMFNSGRVMGAQALPQIGIQQEGVGTNLYGQAPGILNTGTNANSQLADISQRQQQMGLNFWGGLGSGLLGLATIPFGGAPGGLLGKGLTNIFQPRGAPTLP